jgi:hypothetical protein
MILEAWTWGDKAIAMLPSSYDPSEAARIYAKTAFLKNFYMYDFLTDPDEKLKYAKESKGYFEKAVSLSEADAHIELLTVSLIPETWGTLDYRITVYSKALEFAKQTRDNFLIGSAFDLLAYLYGWKSVEIEDVQEGKAALDRVLKCAEDARHFFSRISYVSPRGGFLWSEEPYAEYYQNLARFETNVAKKRDYFKKAVEHGLEQLKIVEKTEYPSATSLAHHALSKVLTLLATLEEDTDEKKRLLEMSLVHRNEDIVIFRQIRPFANSIGVMYIYLGDIKAELSKIETDPKKKEETLREAVFHKEYGLPFCMKIAMLEERGGDTNYYTALGLWQKTYGETLNQLYAITNNSEDQRKAIQVFGEAANSFLKKDLSLSAAECHWKIANCYHNLNDNLKAADSFSLASQFYKKAAEKMPEFKNFFEDNWLYMDAWSQIEGAQHHHLKQEYGSAKECYKKAADLHGSSKRWGYLASNYLAWANIEDAEDLSRLEEGERAINSFKEAAHLFSQSKVSLEDQVGRIEEPEEKQMCEDLIQAAEIRHEYCTARILLEEAKALDRRGQHSLSSDKYGKAAEAFEKQARMCESERDKMELGLIATLSHAWQKMTLAKTDKSPSLFLEASRLFERAKEDEPNEKMKVLALGHSHFCKAMEAGMRFLETMDESRHTSAIKQLGSALDYYAEAGFQNASQYAKATGLLFDAYFYSDKAKREKDPKKKARLYLVAETVLEKSIVIYKKIDHLEKAQQVSRLLEDIREEREIAMSLTQVFYNPLIASTSTLPTPKPSFEKAAGSDGFEHADVQVHLAAPLEMLVGDEFDLRLDLFNSTDHPSMLVRVEGMLPPNIRLTELDPKCSIEGESLDMKGRRLDPLRVESIRLRAQATTAGVIALSPKVVFVDELGNFRTRSSEPPILEAKAKTSFQAKKDTGFTQWLRGSSSNDKNS